MPADFMAVSSELSPKFPKVMREERRMASGNACGTRNSPIYQKNCANTSTESPFPMSLSTCCHKNCIIKTNWQMKNVPTKSSPNCLTINISNFLIRNITIIKTDYRPVERCSSSKFCSQIARSASMSSASAKSVICRI